MRIGIFGGCFDPITKSHLHICNDVLSLNYVDNILILPAYKSINGKIFTATDEQRINMCELAIAENGDDRIRLCDYEIKNKLELSPLEIIDKLEANLCYNKLYFIIGSDNALNLKKLEQYNKFANKYKFVVASRENYDFECHSDHFIILNNQKLAGSSTMVRADISANNELLHLSVLNYAMDIYSKK